MVKEEFILFTKINQLLNKMQLIKESGIKKKKELTISLEELAIIQKKITAIEHDINKLQEEYDILEEEVRPYMSRFLYRGNEKDII